MSRLSAHIKREQLLSAFRRGDFDELSYTVRDTGGAVLSSGTYSADGQNGAYFGVVSDSDLIGSIELTGTRFSGALASQEYADNIQAWVPAPGAIADLGLGGAFMSRRRR